MEKYKKHMPLDKDKKNIWYIGAGISGSENEILTGASLMIGGSRDAYDSIVDMIKNI